MAACSFNIPFSSPVREVLDKAKSAVESQGGAFTGDEQSGNFDVSIFGNAIVGSYTVASGQLAIVIHEKPFLVSCSMIESFLKKQLT